MEARIEYDPSIFYPGASYSILSALSIINDLRLKKNANKIIIPPYFYNKYKCVPGELIQNLSNQCILALFTVFPSLNTDEQRALIEFILLLEKEKSPRYDKLYSKIHSVIDFWKRSIKNKTVKEYEKDETNKKSNEADESDKNSSKSKSKEYEKDEEAYKKSIELKMKCIMDNCKTIIDTSISKKCEVTKESAKSQLTISEKFDVNVNYLLEANNVDRISNDCILFLFSRFNSLKTDEQKKLTNFVYNLKKAESPRFKNLIKKLPEIKDILSYFSKLQTSPRNKSSHDSQEEKKLKSELSAECYLKTSMPDETLKEKKKKKSKNKTEVEDEQRKEEEEDVENNTHTKSEKKKKKKTKEDKDLLKASKKNRTSKDVESINKRQSSDKSIGTTSGHGLMEQFYNLPLFSAQTTQPNLINYNYATHLPNTLNQNQLLLHSPVMVSNTLNQNQLLLYPPTMVPSPNLASEPFSHLQGYEGNNCIMFPTYANTNDKYLDEYNNMMSAINSSNQKQILVNNQQNITVESIKQNSETKTVTASKIEIKTVVSNEITSISSNQSPTGKKKRKRGQKGGFRKQLPIDVFNKTRFKLLTDAPLNRYDITLFLTFFYKLEYDEQQRLIEVLKVLEVTKPLTVNFLRKYVRTTEHPDESLIKITWRPSKLIAIEKVEGRINDNENENDFDEDNIKDNSNKKRKLYMSEEDYIYQTDESSDGNEHVRKNGIKSGDSKFDKMNEVLDSARKKLQEVNEKIDEENSSAVNYLMEELHKNAQATMQNTAIKICLNDNIPKINASNNNILYNQDYNQNNRTLSYEHLNSDYLDVNRLQQSKNIIEHRTYDQSHQNRNLHGHYSPVNSSTNQNSDQHHTSIIPSTFVFCPDFL